MADTTILDGQKMKAALDEFAEDGLRVRKDRIDQTPTNKWRFIYIGMYFIAPMFLLLFLMMGRYS